MLSFFKHNSVAKDAEVARDYEFRRPTTVAVVAAGAAFRVLGLELEFDPRASA